MAKPPQSAASIPTAGDLKVPRSTVSAAVGALLKWKAQSTSEQPQQLLPQDDFIYLNLTLKKIPAKSRTNPFKIALPHPLFDPASEVCLIIDDRPNSNLTSEMAKKIVKSQNIPVSKVLKLSKLKSNYKPFEAKRKLCDSYELFLVDRRIVHLLPKLLGKFFFKKKKLPLPLDLTHKNWKEQIERAMGCGFLFMRTGTCCVMKVGKISMESEEIVDNIVQGINGVVKVVPKKWAGVRSLHLKFSDSVALPIYQALPDVKLRIDGLVPSEQVRETEVKEVSSGGEEKKDKEKKKKKKGRIHEVQYMDVGVGAVELEIEDDDDKNEEMKNMDAEENVVGHDEKQGNESKKSEYDNDDEDIDTDDVEVKNRKKEKLVKGLEKKVRKVEKGGKAEAKKSRSLRNAAESGEKKEKKKRGSIMKKSSRSLS